MAGLIDDAVIERIRQSLDIEDVVGSYLPLKRSGSTLKALCPFHNDSRPSLTVNAKMQIFKCFACGAGGSIFKFVEMYEKVTFPEAVRILAERAGIPVVSQSTEDAQREHEKQDIYRALEWACKVYERALQSPEGAAGAAYFEKRKFEAATLERFRCGFAPGGWDYLIEKASQQNLELSLLEKAGLAQFRDGRWRDQFVNRVMFPIADARGRIIAFGGRVLDGSEPKYLNSPETPVFQKRRGVFALHLAKDGMHRRNKAVVMEGYTDVMMAHQSGNDYCVATLGTALTPEQVQLLRRYAPATVLIFDSDEAGIRAAERSVEVLIAEQADVRVTFIPEGKDPDEYIKTYGGEAFANVVDEAQDVLDFKIGRIRERGALETEKSRTQAAVELLQLVGTSQNPMLRDLYVRKIAEATGVHEVYLRRELQRQRRTGPGADAAAPRRESPPVAPIPDVLEAIERRLASIPLHRPDMLGVVTGSYGPDEFQHPAYRALLRRMLERQQAGLAFSMAALLDDFAGAPEAGSVEMAYRAAEGVVDFGLFFKELTRELSNYELTRVQAPRIKERVRAGEYTDEELLRFHALHERNSRHRSHE